jgi:hypothetical protein
VAPFRRLVFGLLAAGRSRARACLCASGDCEVALFGVCGLSRRSTNCLRYEMFIGILMENEIVNS